MKRSIFRYVSEKELELFLRGYHGLGDYFKNSQNFNTFRYKKYEKYLHFFKNKKDIRLIRESYKGSGGHFYICTFQVPVRRLIFHSGTGFYYEKGKYKKTCVKEYALPSREFLPSWISKVEKDFGQEIVD